MSHKETMQRYADEYRLKAQAALRRSSLANQLLRGLISSCRGEQLSAEAADQAQELLNVLVSSSREYGRTAIRAVIYSTEALADEVYTSWWDVSTEDSRNVSRLLMEAKYRPGEYLPAIKDMTDNIIAEDRNA